MIDQQKVKRYASEARVSLDLAEREIILVYALEWLRLRGILDHLAFKGGTFLRKMILGSEGRFSEDLDFNAVAADRIAAKEILAILPDTFEGIAFSLADRRDLKDSWGAEVNYAHSWNHGSFGLDISYREPPWLKVVTRAPLAQSYFRDLPFKPPRVACLRLEEAMAEKIRAAQQRMSERDLYDLIRYADRKNNEALVRLLAVVKLWKVRVQFDPSSLLNNLEAGRSDWSNLNHLVGKAAARDWNKDCERAAARLSYLADLTAFEKEILRDIGRHALVSKIRAEVARLDAKGP